LKEKDKKIKIKKIFVTKNKMDSHLSHSKHYGSGVLLVVILVVVAVLILWAIFRNNNDKNKHHHSRHHSSDDCEKTSESKRYSDSHSASRNSASRDSGSHSSH